MKKLGEQPRGIVKEDRSLETRPRSPATAAPATDNTLDRKPPKKGE
jgi:hypothetical protein